MFKNIDHHPNPMKEISSYPGKTKNPMSVNFCFFEINTFEKYLSRVKTWPKGLSVFFCFKNPQRQITKNFFRQLKKFFYNFLERRKFNSFICKLPSLTFTF
jgi:hypothetical protein